MPKSTGGGYGVPATKEVHIDCSLKDNTQRARLICLHEVTELWWQDIKYHSDIDLFCIDVLDCYHQLGL